MYAVSVAQSGNGSSCPNDLGDTRACLVGDDDCTGRKKKIKIISVLQPSITLSAICVVFLDLIKYTVSIRFTFNAIGAHYIESYSFFQTRAGCLKRISGCGA